MNVGIWRACGAIAANFGVEKVWQAIRAVAKLVAIPTIGKVGQASRAVAAKKKRVWQAGRAFAGKRNSRAL